MNKEQNPWNREIQLARAETRRSNRNVGQNKMMKLVMHYCKPPCPFDMTRRSVGITGIHEPQN